MKFSFFWQSNILLLSWFFFRFVTFKTAWQYLCTSIWKYQKEISKNLFWIFFWKNMKKQIRKKYKKESKNDPDFLEIFFNAMPKLKKSKWKKILVKRLFLFSFLSACMHATLKVPKWFEWKENKLGRRSSPSERLKR